jgi:hypothetical protein
LARPRGRRRWGPGHTFDDCRPYRRNWLRFLLRILQFKKGLQPVDSRRQRADLFQQSLEILLRYLHDGLAKCAA